jgi:hypothetical protein
MTTDQHHRTLHYIDVIYLKDGHFKSRKAVHFPELEANQMYYKTIAKLKKEGTSALICLREENHELLKNERV